QHTAVKIAPRYQGAVIHVLDASKSVVVCGNLLSQERIDGYLEDIRDDYSDIRDEYYMNLNQIRCVAIELARKKRYMIDWMSSTFEITKPTYLGNKVYNDYDLSKLVNYIDWKPFFDAMQIRGKYPNRGYPKLFDCKEVGAQARILFDEAQALLNEVLSKNLFKAQAVVGFYPCRSHGDDIILYDPNDQSKQISTLYGLRQQIEREGEQQQTSYMCLSDFISSDPNKLDYIGLFALAIFNVEQIGEQYAQEKADDYSSIIIRLLGDRLAEAFAEELHERVRKVYWGYAPDEHLPLKDLLSVAYQGIRPAAGYPTQPDHTEKLTIWNILNVEQLTGIQLTESLAMKPVSAVSGLYFAHPKSTYFAVGKINEDQVRRKRAVALTPFFSTPNIFQKKAI
ncbi:unnamed protein product, partial [Didymodactylos carnosus]